MNKNLIILLGIVLISILVAIILNYSSIIEFFIHPYLPIKPGKIDNRALVIIVEDNDFVKYDEESQIWYDNNKSFIDLLLGVYLRVPKKEFKDKISNKRLLLSKIKLDVEIIKYNIKSNPVF